MSYRFSVSPPFVVVVVVARPPKALTLICSQLLVYSFSLAGDIDHSLRISPDKSPLTPRSLCALSAVNSNRLNRSEKASRQSSNNDVTR